MISLSTKCIGQNSDLIVQLQDLPILENHFISQVCESQLISTLPPLNLFVALEIYSKNNLSKFSKPTQCRYFSNWFMVGRSPQNIPLSQAFPNNCLVTCDVPFRTAAIGLDKILKAHRTNAKGRGMLFSNCIRSFLAAYFLYAMQERKSPFYLVYKPKPHNVSRQRELQCEKQKSTLSKVRCWFERKH